MSNGAAGSTGGDAAGEGGSSGGGPTGGTSAQAGTLGKGGSTASGGATATGGATAKGGATATGGAASCADACPPNGTCSASGATMKCECHSGFVGNGVSCRRPISCQELHQASPSLPSGAYVLRPALATQDFESYCEMSASGGGWTLILNHGTEFDPSAPGSSSELAYAGKGTNLSYSTVLLQSDVMLDIRIDAIAAETYTARVIIEGVHAATRGKVVRNLFASGPNYLEAEDNSNLTLVGRTECNFSPTDLPPLLCDSSVLVFGDQDTGCAGTPTVFAIGGARSYTQAWNDCAGWPQATVVNGTRHYPDNFRVWIR